MGFLIVFLGGGIGAASRHGINLLAARMLGTGFPYGTILINVAGSLAMGLIAEFFALKGGLPQHWRLFLTTGILGGFTTFSAFSLEAALALRARRTHRRSDLRSGIGRSCYPSAVCRACDRPADCLIALLRSQSNTSRDPCRHRHRRACLHDAGGGLPFGPNRPLPAPATLTRKILPPADCKMGKSHFTAAAG